MNQGRAIRGRASTTTAMTSWDASPYDQVADGPDLAEIRGSESFSGDITGAGVFRFLQVLRKDGSATFCGTERVVGALAGRGGSFVLQHEGTLADGQVEGRWFVVPGSGTGELTGLRGDGGYAATLGQHARCHLTFHFERLPD